MKRLRNRPTARAARWQRARAVASGLILCGLLAACGNTVPATPVAPGTASPTATSPTPSPSPGVTSAGHLNVLQRPWVMTYEIDPTGRLRPPVTQRVSNDLYVLAGEPQGRFVYGGHGSWLVGGTGGDGSDATIVTYAPDPRDGTLAGLSESTVRVRPPVVCGGCIDHSGWLWLKGGANRVHGLWVGSSGTAGRHSTSAYVSVAVASDGQLGVVSQQELHYDADPGLVLVDVRSDVLYKAGPQPVTADTISARGGLEAHVIEPDGTLNRMGWTNLCLARTMCEYCSPSPQATARGFVFASLFGTVCAYQGLRLKPLYALDLSAGVAEAFVPSSEAEPALLAMNVAVSTGGMTQHELRLFSMNSEGDLRPLARQELQKGLRQILFHPSGRFLYTVDAASALQAYSIDSSGRLELLMSIDHAGNSMAITLTGPRAADH